MGRTTDVIFRVLGGGVPRSSREVCRAAGLSGNAVWKGVDKLWRDGRCSVVRSLCWSGKEFFVGGRGKPLCANR